MKKSLLFLSILIILSQGCSYAVRYDGTYSGKVVDADTGEPIEGAVVLRNLVYRRAYGRR